MFDAKSIVATPQASRYLQQLCKHWGHRFAVDFDPAHGTIAFPNATLTLDADAEALRLTLDSADDAILPRLSDVVSDHLRRFAFREELVIAWSGLPSGQGE